MQFSRDVEHIEADAHLNEIVERSNGNVGGTLRTAFGEERWAPIGLSTYDHEGGDGGSGHSDDPLAHLYFLRNDDWNGAENGNAAPEPNDDVHRGPRRPSVR